jgi:transcription antitermination factor NusG
MNSITKKNYNWHAVYLRSRTEKKVYIEILNKGIECYLPLKSTKRIWSDRIKVITEPILPGYIFVRVSTHEYYDVLVINGVLRYVCFDNKPAIVSDYQISLLKLFVEHLNDKIEVSTERIKKGNFVKIISGPLRDVIGEVIEARGKRHLLLRFDQLGYILQVNLSENEVELLPDKNFALVPA